MTQNSQMCARALDQVNAMIGRVTPQQLQWSTPDHQFTVAALIDHVAKNASVLAEAIRPDEPAPAGDWHERYTALKDALAEVGDTSRVVTMPFGQLPLEAALGAMTGEFATHAWDIATALGIDDGLEDNIGEAAYLAMKQGVPAEGRVPGGPFAPVVDVPDSAPPYDRLAGWTGRDPQWKPESPR